MRVSNCILSLAAAAAAQAKLVIHNWDITYLTTSRGLDQAPKRGITVNGQFPLPVVEAEIGDMLILNVHNSLDVPTSLHAHGIFQRGTNYYDGPSMITECSIAPGTNFTYEIPLKQSGTYWIHGHTSEHNFDGLRTPLIIHDPEERYDYNDEYLFTLEDWSPWTMKQSLDFLLTPRQTGLPLDPPLHGLVNGFNGNLTKPIRFEPGKTYRIRLVPMLSFPAMEFSIDDHDLILYEIDGARTKPKTLKTIRMSPGERSSVLVKAKDSKDKNYSYHVSMVTPRLPAIPGSLPSIFNGTVEYDPRAPLVPTTEVPSEEFDEITVESLEYLPALKVDRSLFMNSTLGYTPAAVTYDTFDLIEFRAPKVPTMLSALTMGEMAKNPLIYGPQTNTEVFNLNEVIEVVVFSTSSAPHMFHLHGHMFQVIERGLVNDVNGTSRRTVPSRGFSPLLRDTVFVSPFTYVVIRFRADNPGAWLFHCHLDWHTPNLRSVFVSAPDVMQRTLKVPQSVLDQCRIQGIPTSGNVVGRHNYSIDGAPILPDLLPSPPPL
ncbi:ferroxidase fet3 [Linderina macrospora]|uniref:Ferroxidase fet3 n=1 Tax=Linderina macrospora TaxID=4868 RepID=A0ACC1JFK8_9FUNG|nr:ferroxidase fet3 [Linderina macrospora]